MGGADGGAEASIWASLDEVGKTKAVGYLPLYTIRDHLKREATEVARELEGRGLTVGILTEEESKIKSGSLFAFDRLMAETIIARHANVLAQKRWSSDVDQVMTEISTVWFGMDDPAMPLIKELYNDQTSGSAPGESS